jgi:4-diphosphocytidyl-2-C-methyl-D-erythritol kinase
VPARPTVSTVTVRAPAKVNLYLSVGPVRGDGYHELTTVFQAIGLYDDVTVSRGEGLTVRVVGDSVDQVPTDRTNLAARAVLALVARTGQAPDVEVLIRKKIPVAGGCAGGSADAAAALLACVHLWGLSLSKAELMEIAAEVGSDVPFCLQGGIALGTGRGEQLTSVLGHGVYWWVLALADEGLSTARVYDELDRQRADGRIVMESDLSQVLAAVRQGSAVNVGRALSNDLQPAAESLNPSLRGLVALGEELGALGTVLSGSGPTVAFLARDEEHAAALGGSLVGHCRAVRIVDGPVPGARVVKAS